MEISKWDGWPHVTETQQFARPTIESLLAQARKVEQALVHGKKPPRLSSEAPKIVKFYRDEASTRTEDTFWYASHLLGHTMRMIIGDFSSAVKGEPLEDLSMALTQVGGLGSFRTADFFIVRHAIAGAAQKAVDTIEATNEDGYPRLPLPVINAGDGDNQHPTQALGDLLTICSERKTGDKHPLEDFVMVFGGDTHFSRVVNSDCHLLGRFGEDFKIHIIFSCHAELEPKRGILEYLTRHKVTYEFQPDLRKAVRGAHAVSMSRIQKERFKDRPELFQQIKGASVFGLEHLDLLPEGSILIHPMPIDRTPEHAPSEIAPELARLAYVNHPKVAFGRQSHRNTFMRYTLLDVIQAGIEELTV